MSRNVLLPAPLTPGATVAGHEVSSRRAAVSMWPGWWMFVAWRAGVVFVFAKPRCAHINGAGGVL